MSSVVFMGTSAFAVPALQVLLEGDATIAAVVTQPDRPAGRSRQPRYSPVKDFALQHRLPVWQPPTLRPPAAVAHLRDLAPDVVVVAAYGEILRPAMLALPPHGCLNIHGSLLPRHRGAAPVVSTILSGDAQAGVTLMQMDAGMDTGPILAQEAIALTGQERQGELLLHLAAVGANLLRRALPAWLAGEIVPRPQDEALATYSAVLRKEDGQIDWTRPAWHIERMVRAYDPWPGAYTFLRGRRMLIARAGVLPPGGAGLPGTLSLHDGRLLVATGEGTLLLAEVQLEGKRRLSAAEFLQGQRDLEGVRLG